MRKLFIYLLIALVIVALIASIVEAKEKKYAGRKGETAKKASPSQKKNVEIDINGNIAGGLDDDDIPTPSASSGSKKYSSTMDDDDEDDDEENDDDSTEDSMHDDDSVVEDYTPPPPPMPELYTIDDNGSKQWKFMNTETTTNIWRSISNGDLSSLTAIVDQDPDSIHHRSEDGRGALFWAYEFDHDEIIQYLIDKGADEEAVDANGETPKQLKGRGKK